MLLLTELSWIYHLDPNDKNKTEGIEYKRKEVSRLPWPCARGAKIDN